MGFFYSDNKVVKKSSTRKASIIDVATLNSSGCIACSLDKDKSLNNPKMQAIGSKRPLIYVLGDSPDTEDDSVGEPFTGEATKLFRNLMPIEDEDGVRWNNVIRCLPPRNRAPNKIEVECCRGYIRKDIERSRPHVILGIGMLSTSWVLGELKTGIQSLRGRVIPVQVGKHLCWFIPVLPASFMVRTKGRGNRFLNREKFLERDLKKALSVAKNRRLPRHIPLTKKEIFKNIECITGEGGSRDFLKLKKALQSLYKEPYLGIDIETFAKKVNKGFDKSPLIPFAPESRLLSMSIGTFDSAVAFAVDHPKGWKGSYKRRVRRLLSNFLIKCPAKFIAYNAQYEILWMSTKLGKHVVDAMHWEDAMAAACAMDSRKYVLSLDTQCLFNFGFNLKDFTKNLDKSNLIEENLGEVLEYNGGDVRWTYQLFVKKQIPLMASRYYESTVPTYNHLVRSAKTLAHMQKLGLTPSKKALIRYGDYLSKKIVACEKIIKGTPQARRFKKRYSRDYNSMSDKDNEALFSHILKRKEVLVDDPSKEHKKKFSLDKTVLASIDLKICKQIGDLRRYLKLNSTYIEGTSNLIFPDGKLHAAINLMFTFTGRLSWENPNGQNYPKRNDKYIRNVIMAGLGKMLVAIDFGQIEARCIGMASEDEAFCRMLIDGYDVHMDWVERFLAADSSVIDRFLVKTEYSGPEDEKAVLKAFRDKVKNGWVFPLFFGSHFLPASNSMGVTSRVGERLYNEFWDVFGGVKEWQEYMKDFYNRKGYVETLTGRRRYGPLTLNEVINTPIQGTASDIVVNASNELYDAGLTPILNIHDDLSSEVPKEEVKQMARNIASIMCKPYYDFINVPLVVDVEIGKYWGSMKTLREYDSVKDFGYPLR